MEIITSRANPRIKAAAALKNAKNRKDSGLFLIEGARLCSDAAENGAVIKELFITEDASKKYSEAFSVISDRAEQVFFIEESVAEKLSDTQNTQQIFCVCKMLEHGFSLQKDGIYVMTDNIQTPDNIGAVVRSAEALGFNGLVVNGGCDIYSPKAQRAAMGALLRFPVMQVFSADKIIDKCETLGIKVFSAVAESEAQDIRYADKTGGIMLIIGNEGNGVSENILARSKQITIPMRGKAESLNASAAAAIAMWEFLR